MSTPSPVQVDANGTAQRLARRVGQSALESSQWEQAYYDLEARDQAVIDSLSSQVESLRQQLAAAASPAEPAKSETG